MASINSDTNVTDYFSLIGNVMELLVLISIALHLQLKSVPSLTLSFTGSYPAASEAI